MIVVILVVGSGGVVVILVVGCCVVVVILVVVGGGMVVGFDGVVVFLDGMSISRIEINGLMVVSVSCIIESTAFVGCIKLLCMMLDDCVVDRSGCRVTSNGGSGSIMAALKKSKKIKIKLLTF